MRIHTRPPTEASPILFVAGLATLGSVFLVAHGAYGDAPWAVFRADGPPTRWGIALLWTLTGVIALATAPFRSFGARASLLVAFGTALLATCRVASVGGSPWGAGPSVGPWALAIAAGGLVGAARPDGSHASRTTVFLGAAVFLAHYAFVQSGLQLDLDSIGVWFGTDPDLSGARKSIATGAHGAAVLGAVAGLVVGLGVRVRWVAWAGFGLILAATFVPALSMPVLFRNEASFADALRDAAEGSLVRGGGALFLLTIGVVADLLPRGKAGR